MQVTSHNIKKLKALVMNGAYKHPGANFYIERNTKMRRYCVTLMYTIYLSIIMKEFNIQFQEETIFL